MPNNFFNNSLIESLSNFDYVIYDKVLAKINSLSDKNNITIYPSKNQNDNCFRLSTIGNLEIGDIKYVLKIFNEYFKDR